MRMQILKIMVVLLVAGSGDSRPQEGSDSARQTETKEASIVGWKSDQVSNKSQDIIRDDSRYTGTSGSNRKYITYFRDNVGSSREHNTLGSRTNEHILAPNGKTQLFNTQRRPKINDIWTRSEFKEINTSSSRTDVLSEIKVISGIQNSGKADELSPYGPSEIIYGEKINWIRPISASNRDSDLELGQTNRSAKSTIKNLQSWKSDVILNQNFRSMVTPMKYSPVENDFLASRASSFHRRNYSISDAKNRRGSDSIKSNQLSNKDIRSNILYRKAEQNLNISSPQIARTNILSKFQKDSFTHSMHKSRNSIRKNTNRTNSTLQDIISYENRKPNFVTDFFHHIDGLNNSGNLSLVVKTHSIPTSNSESGIVDRSRAAFHRNTIISNRNLVRLRYPFSNLQNASNIVLNTKLNNNVRRAVQLTESTKHQFTQAAAKRPDINNHATFEPMNYKHSSLSQNLPSQADTIDGGNETGDSATSVQYNVHFKNWPNEALEEVEDLYNYEKYTSALQKDSNNDSNLQNFDRMPIPSLEVDYFNHPDPILDSSVKKIIHWLKIPTIAINDTNYMNNNDDVHKSVESVLEPIYENLEPNRPLNHNDHYETVVLENTQNQKFDEMNYHENYSNEWSTTNSIAHLQYMTDPSIPSTILTPSSWSDEISDEMLKNNTIYNPLTHVTQNTIIHIPNDVLKKVNATMMQLKVPEINQTVSPESSLQPSSEIIHRPNNHVALTSQKHKNNKPSKFTSEANNSSPLIYNTDCPTITINTYTHINNTIQSKEACSNMNIVFNSHVTSTNMFKPSDEILGGDQQISLATQSYDNAVGSDKYSEGIDDLVNQDSLNSYVTGTYDSSPFETPQSSESYYHDIQKDPAEIPESSSVEIFQGTHISLSESENDPLTDDAEATTMSPVPPGANNPAGSSVDGPIVDNDVLSSAIDPPAAGASVVSGPSAIGNPSSVAQELPVYLTKPGPVKGQANNGLAPGSLQLSSLPNLSIKPGLPSISSLSSTLPSYDDDDDDDFDMSPGGLLQSITSVFTYFTFLNPLGYSFISLAAAPFAAMAAGILGVAAIVFPWALPNVLDIGRAADKVTIRFRPNLEEFVRQAVHKYDRLNEWKGRRRKRRR